MPLSIKSEVSSKISLMREAGSSFKMMSSQVPRMRARKIQKTQLSRVRRKHSPTKTQNSLMKTKTRMMIMIMILTTFLGLEADLEMKD